MEIYGIGTDIIEISRIREAINRTSSFKRKVYTEKEIERRRSPMPVMPEDLPQKRQFQKHLEQV